MDRINCPMTEVMGDEVYCGYYDMFYMECFKNKNCPEEDNEDECDEDIYEDY